MPVIAITIVYKYIKIKSEIMFIKKCIIVI